MYSVCRVYGFMWAVFEWKQNTDKEKDGGYWMKASRDFLFEEDANKRKEEYEKSALCIV